MAVQAKMIWTDLPFKTMVFTPTLITGIEKASRRAMVTKVVWPMSHAWRGAISAKGKYIRPHMAAA